MDEGHMKPANEAAGGQPAAQQLTILPARLSDEDAAALASAVALLEHESLAARITHALGQGVASAGSLVPLGARRIAERAASIALERAVAVAISSLGRGDEPPRTRFHKSLAAASGAAGGAFGLAALPLELPVSTILIMRSIADVARSQGEDLAAPETALACVEVFALGGRTSLDDQMDSAYFSMRVMLASSVTEAVRHISRHGVAAPGAPALVRLVSQVAGRFGVAVSQKLAAQSVPIVGAIGGAAINYAFADHFTTLARGHFTVRRLERAYGADFVREEYERLAARRKRGSAFAA
jgi:hypothetical protein